MNNTIVNLIVVAALSFSGAALAAAETESKAQPPAAQPAVQPVTAKPVAAASVVPPATALESTPPAPAKEPPHAKRSVSGKSAKVKKTMRAKNLDLRHCLDLESNAAIAKCAGE